MINLGLSLSQIQFFIIVFIRVSAILFASPLFGAKNVPMPVKAGLALGLSLSVFPVIPLNNAPPISGPFLLGAGLIGEIVLGMIIGFVVKLVFAGIQLAGQLAGYQMGMAIANVLDPQSNTQVSLISQFNYLVAMLIFLTINAHHYMIRALMESFTLVPPLEFLFSAALVEKLIHLSGDMFVIAIKIGAPIIATMLLTSVALGLMARTVPQMQIFIVAMPVQIMVGLAIIAFSLPYLSSFLKVIYRELGQNIFFILKAMG